MAQLWGIRCWFERNLRAIERFWFATPNVRMRTSAVKRFGGFSTSTFCTEVRVEPDSDVVAPAAEKEPVASEFYSALGW